MKNGYYWLRRSYHDGGTTNGWELAEVIQPVDTEHALVWLLGIDYSIKSTEFKDAEWVEIFPPEGESP
jgi:hypothetical protein